MSKIVNYVNMEPDTTNTLDLGGSGIVFKKGWFTDISATGTVTLGTVGAGAITGTSFTGSGLGLTGVGLLASANTWTLNNIFSTSVTTPQVYGGSGASGTLTLTSTSHGTKGTIIAEDNFVIGKGTALATYSLTFDGNQRDGTITFDDDAFTGISQMTFTANLLRMEGSLIPVGDMYTAGLFETYGGFNIWPDEGGVGFNIWSNTYFAGDTVITSDTNFDFSDTFGIRLGTGNDLSIYHNGTNSFLDNATGYLKLGGAGLVVLNSTKATTGDPTPVEGMIYINTYDNVIKMYADSGWRTLASW